MVIKENRIIIENRSIERDRLLLIGRRSATGLPEMGVGEDNSVALLPRNDFAFLAAVQGATLLGAYAVPINWHFKSGEVRYILDDLEPNALVAHADLLADVGEAIPGGFRFSLCPPRPKYKATFIFPMNNAASRSMPSNNLLLRFG